MTKKNQDDRNTRAAGAGIFKQAQLHAQLLNNNVQLVQKESLDKRFGGVSAIEGARACLAKADSGNRVLGELAMSLKRLSLEVSSGAYKSQADQIDAALLQRAGELGRVTSVQITGDVSVFGAMNKVVKEQHKVLRAFVDAIDTQILAHQAPPKRRSPKP